METKENWLLPGAQTSWARNARLPVAGLLRGVLSLLSVVHTESLTSGKEEDNGQQVTMAKSRQTDPSGSEGP